MNRRPVESSHLKSVGYDPAESKLHVEFQSGDVYEYSGVSPQTHADLLTAKSKGGHFRKAILGKFDAKKVE